MREEPRARLRPRPRRIAPAPGRGPRAPKAKRAPRGPGSGVALRAAVRRFSFGGTDVRIIR
jgi:hypothetical protein